MRRSCRSPISISRPPYGWQVTDEETVEDQLAVIAHGLLTPMAEVVGASTRLKRAVASGDDFDPTPILDVVIDESRRVIDVLRDLVRSGDPTIVAALDALREEST